MGNMDWVDEREETIKKESAEGFFNIEEGDNRIQLLTHCAALPLMWDAKEKKYRPAQEGETGASIKGVCWVLHDGKLKQAKLPYTVVKLIRGLQQDQDYAFEEFPMPRYIKITAKGAGTKEVEYGVIPSPKEAQVPETILAELAKKPTPEEIVEKEKSKTVSQPNSPVEYPTEDFDTEDTPF